MPASFTPNREAALSAMWWLFKDATFFSILANTTGAASPPALNADYSAWEPYVLAGQFDTFTASGSVAYDSTLTQRAKLPQQEISLSFASTVTYTDVLVAVIPAVNPGSGVPSYARPSIGVIHEPTAFTLTAGATKTYRLDLYSQWI
jgi:hypothetical protein